MKKILRVTEQEITAALGFRNLSSTSTNIYHAMAQYAKSKEQPLLDRIKELEQINKQFLEDNWDLSMQITNLTNEFEYPKPTDFDVREFALNICTAIKDINLGNRHIARDITDKWLSILSPSTAKEPTDAQKEQPKDEAPKEVDGDKFRVGKKQRRAILNQDGSEYLLFPIGQEDAAEKYCQYLNQQSNPQPTISNEAQAVIDAAVEWYKAFDAEKELVLAKAVSAYKTSKNQEA